uniref:Gypsy retrotransposon integrase-like protein 1 n=1 Tax=Cyprinus carpio TaxID=7962 RepID=A0A8C1GLQ5_CYPCA
SEDKRPTGPRPPRFWQRGHPYQADGSSSTAGTQSQTVHHLHPRRYQGSTGASRSRHPRVPGQWKLGSSRICLYRSSSAGIGRGSTASPSQPVSPTGNRPQCQTTTKPRRRPVLLASDSPREGESSRHNPNLFYDLFQQVAGAGAFAREQHEDDRLKHCWAQVRVTEGKDLQPAPRPTPHFVVKDGLLYCVAQRRGEEKTLLVGPWTKTGAVMELAHAHPMAGHLGAQNTIQRIRDRFHWPGLEAEVKRFCMACPTCQRTSPRTPPPSPLIRLPIIEVPFERIGMDLVGPLPKSARGHEHILVILDYVTRYPEAIPLRKATAKAIAQKLFPLSSRVGLPSQILTDQGTPFMSRVMANLCKLLKIKQL